MINSFQGEHRWLSNFWPAKVVLEDIEFPTVEHAYVAAKTLDMAMRLRVSEIPAQNAGRVKRLGRTFDLRVDWDDVRLSTMERLLRQKFAIPDLRMLLLKTGNQILIEGNTWGDTFWGVCRGTGENNLGNLLMKIRSEIYSASLLS